MKTFKERVNFSNGNSDEQLLLLSITKKQNILYLKTAIPLSVTDTTKHTHWARGTFYEKNKKKKRKVNACKRFDSDCTQEKLTLFY